MKISKDILNTTFFHAILITMPIMFGYVSGGIAFGLLLTSKDIPWIFAPIMSLFIYAGSMQFIAIQFFLSNTNLITIAIITLLINCRHMLYGLSLLEKFNLTGKFKPYMIFTLTDETYALLTTLKETNEANKSKFYIYISSLNHFYWVFGTLIGAILGNIIKFNTKGLDFTLTALFLVILIEQIRSYKTRLPLWIGAICAIGSIAVVGKENMLLPSIIMSTLFLMIFKKGIIQNEHN
ncbi:4-azaleucine resistance probable transporter AzlC [Thermodesulfobium acidiphilum]|uniref:4-azaleucine resistance probable transporter AzlC n=1 Tax=Thermodesulfobium acidiphilum TaxID=1794699 RepID=A0A2R4W0P0_THEAF|nr:AzlC family ABC transporter permease [Thermodesulfobium acidiphilum]AWB10286.1 4-azaleucine resistance probable transporter AzlC [Thermodesulfobium acidiphilum]